MAMSAVTDLFDAAQHRFGGWWQLHALHHSQRQMTMWSDNRNHHLSHANVRLSFGPVLGRMLLSPRFHRLHHGIGLGHPSAGPGTPGGHNFAVLFPVWDMLFGTTRFDDIHGPTGVRDQLDGREYGRGFWSQQWLGLRRRVGR